MPSKLGHHFQFVPDWARRLATGPYNKIIDPGTDNPFPNSRTIGRVYIPDNETNAMVWRGAQGATEWITRCEPTWARAPWVWCWELPNEPHPLINRDFRLALVDFTNHAINSMHQRGLRAVAINASVGWPDIGTAPDLGPAIEKADYLGLHEYGAPTMQDGATWLCLRWQRTVKELRGAGFKVPPILVTECGIDGGVLAQPGRGWKSYTNQQGYLDQLTWYDRELRKDPLVAGAVIFTSGPTGQWYDFDVDEPLSEKLHTYIESQRNIIDGTLEESMNPYGLQRPLPDGIGYVTQWFGDNPENYKPYGLAGHEGLDYGCAIGTPVLAMHGGRVTTSTTGLYGNHIWLDGPNNMVTVYSHLTQFLVKTGDLVVAGQQIGLSGNTGRSTGPHLHVSMMIRDVVNPAYRIIREGNQVLDCLNPYLGRKLNGDA